MNSIEAKTGSIATPDADSAGISGNPVAALLKTPQRVGDLIARAANPFGTGIIFLVCAILSHAVFGLAMGLFAGWEVALMDVVKVPLTAILALAICFPSLYVFSCVGGAPLSASQAFMLGTSCLAMVGLLLVGLAPVLWVFAVSTQSVLFMAALAFFLWVIAAAFAVAYVGKLQANPLFKRSGAVKFWFLIFMLVTLQMITCLRPVLGKPGSRWLTTEKKFFLAHFMSTYDEKPQAPGKSPGTGSPARQNGPELK